MTDMKKLTCALLLGLAFLACPAAANAHGGWGFGPYQVSAGAKFWFRVSHAPCGPGGYGGGMPQAGPWYLYWPMEAHFQTPAPGVNPYVSPMTLPSYFGGGH